MASLVLEPIRNTYVTLHQDTDSSRTRFFPSTGDQHDLLLSPSYPVCDVAGHIHDDIISTSFAHDSAAHVPASLASPDAPLLSVPAPPRVDESFMDVPPLDNDILFVPESFHPTHKTTNENSRIPATSLDPLTARVIQDGMDTFTRTTPLSTQDLSASTPPNSKASTRQTGAARVQTAANCRTSSDDPDVPSSPSPTPVLDVMLPTESHSSLRTPAAPGLLDPRLSSAPHLGADAEGEGSARAASHMEQDSLYPRWPIYEDITLTPDLPPQLPSPLSILGVATAGPSRRSFDAEYTGDHPPHPSHG
ncbi:hypothetical protein BJY52DRAFT_1315518 [Lactarius psammicola]|nr:hypothetical protein BJY52DRAFT_1315518 [Lactarius psammicola]